MVNKEKNYMKKLIVMMLVLVAVIGGVFAADEKYEKKAEAGASLTLDADSYAQMTMKFKPVEGIKYVNVGFAESGVSVDATTGHLKDVTSASEINLVANTDDNKVIGKGSFQFYYEVITADNVKITLSMPEKFTASDITISDSFGYSAKNGTTEYAGDDADTTITVAEGKSIYSAVTDIAVVTEDASTVKNTEYVAVVKATIATV